MSDWRGRVDAVDGGTRSCGPRALRTYLAILAWPGGSSTALHDAGDVGCTEDGRAAAQADYAQHAARLVYELAAISR
ncbi:MAG: hypothetical protein WBM03_09145 [Steroidobacteraceae bacterium]